MHCCACHVETTLGYELYLRDGTMKHICWGCYNEINPDQLIDENAKPDLPPKKHLSLTSLKKGIETIWWPNIDRISE